MMIEVSGLGKQVATANRHLTILSDINLSVAEGERVAIVGASGSGKTTLLSLLAGLDTASSGQIRFNDVVLNELDEDQRAKLRAEQVGFVFQSFHLLPGLTALENVMLPLELAGRADADSRARQLLDEVGLGERLSHYPNQLSGGEQQRVAIARAFASEPRVLFADEPTGNLDTATGSRIIELLLKLNRDAGTTLILVTHDEALASRCDRRLQLQAGKLVS